MIPFPSIDEFTELGEEIIESLPSGILTHLNGGILIRPERKVSKGLITLGQYVYQPYSLGRYILIFYGSFKALHGQTTKESIKRSLKDTICHELIHHWESLSGTNSLAKEEAKEWRDYFSR